MSETTSWPTGIGAITLFAEDLPATRRFYEQVLQLPFVFEDEHSAVFRIGTTLLNILTISEAPELIVPVPVATPEAGARIQFTIDVDDVDVTAELLVARGAELVNGPMDRPWGIRTAAFRDPAGNVWEIAH